MRHAHIWNSDPEQLILMFFNILVEKLSKHIICKFNFYLCTKTVFLIYKAKKNQLFIISLFDHHETENPQKVTPRSFRYNCRHALNYVQNMVIYFFLKYLCHQNLTMSISNEFININLIWSIWNYQDIFMLRRLIWINLLLIFSNSHNFF